VTLGARGRHLDLADIPALRTFGSARFRVLLAAALSLIGLYMLVLYPSLLS
jgi:hypothetical protein